MKTKRECSWYCMNKALSKASVYGPQHPGIAVVVCLQCHHDLLITLLQMTSIGHLSAIVSSFTVKILLEINNLEYMLCRAYGLAMKVPIGCDDSKVYHRKIAQF